MRLGEPTIEVGRMLEAYEEYYEAAKAGLSAGATAHDVHRAVSKGFTERGYQLGHVTGHSIGMTMIEHPEDRRGGRVDARGEHGLLDASARDRRGRAATCLYMQDTWLVDGRRRRAARAGCRCGSSAAGEHARG